jgi:acetylornithine deacetylase/succinyl-diaminopimelate desuccinylase-like protein
VNREPLTANCELYPVNLVELCQALVKIPSENPSASVASQGEDAIAHFVGNFLEEAGAKVEYEEIAPGRPNVYGLWPSPSPDAKRILFAPHLDTVTVEGMTVDPFGAEIRDGRLYGRGSSDTKGSVAAMLWALKSVDPSKLNVAVGFAGLADEESAQIGAKVCAERRMADFVVVGEPTNLDVVYTHKGTAWIEIETQGRSAHGSTPAAGVNAIDRMANVLQVLKQHFAHLCPVHVNPILGPATLSTGVIRGGSKINVVPDRCVAEIDIRILPGQESMPQAIDDFFREQEILATVRPIKVSAPLYTDPKHPYIQQFVGLGSKLAGATWFCDAAFFAMESTPAIAIGPGFIAQAHTADEFIQVADLERGARFFTAFLKSFSNG